MARAHIYWNSHIAYTMVKHDLGVGPRVPLRMMIYEADAGKARLAYDLPSSVIDKLSR